MKRLAPSMLSADFAELKEQIQIIETSGAQYLHLDIMDGHFVPNLTFGAPVVKCLRKHSKMFFDVHLMIEQPEKYFNDFVSAGADLLNVPVETVDYLPEAVRQIHALGVKAGVTIKPDTSLSAVYPVLDQVDMILVMTVYPGFSGQKLIPEALQKIPELFRIRQNGGYRFDIEIDGGVGLQNLRQVMETGVDVVVAGSAVFGAADPGQACQEFLTIMQEYDRA